MLKKSRRQTVHVTNVSHTHKSCEEHTGPVVGVDMVPAVAAAAIGLAKGMMKEADDGGVGKPSLSLFLVGVY